MWKETPSGRVAVTAPAPVESSPRVFRLPGAPPAMGEEPPPPTAAADDDDDDTSFSWEGVNTTAQCTACARSCSAECADAEVSGCEVKHYSSDGPESYPAHRCVNCMDECLPDEG